MVHSWFSSTAYARGLQDGSRGHWFMDLETHTKLRCEWPPLEELRDCSLPHSVPLASTQQSLVCGQLLLLRASPPMAVFYVCDPKIRPSTNLITSAQNQFPNKLLGGHGFVEYTIQLTMNSNVIVYLIPPTHKSQVQIFFFFFY